MGRLLSGLHPVTSAAAPLGGEAARASSCRHCSSPLPTGEEDFCCTGCATVYQALREGGLERYYTLRDKGTGPVPDLHLERRDHKWLKAQQVQQLAPAVGEDGCVGLRLSLQGLRCAACVWLVEQLFARAPGGRRAWVNPGAATLTLAVTPEFDLLAFVSEVERFGYLVGPPQAAPERHSDSLLLRAGFATAFAGNSMLFSVALYLGLPAGALRDFLHSLNFGLSALAVLVGAPVFLGTAWRSLRHRVLHLDIPVALGIVLSFLAATWAFAFGGDRYGYYDSLSVFIALMLWGRYLQGRVVEQNRNLLLAQGADHGLLARRVVDGGCLQDIDVADIAVGDRLLVTPGDFAPVALELLDPVATVSLDWVQGESEPRQVALGDQVVAGAINLAQRALVGRALQTYADSPVGPLLSAPRISRCEVNRTGSLFAPLYVAAVLFSATGAGIWNALREAGGLESGLAVATAVCVVSCPCAVGLALPLAQELVQSALRRWGLFVREASFLQRAALVEALAFDKTGTLTTGYLRLGEPAVLERLTARERQVLFRMVVGSAHPRALAIRRALQTQHPQDAKLQGQELADEVCGQGLVLQHAGACYRLGRAAWAASVRTAGGDQDLVLTRDGIVLIEIQTVEESRHDLGQACQRLRELGMQLYIVSGDGGSRVRALGARLGIPASHLLAEQRPEDKAAWIDSRAPRRTLMLGDGINDTLALERAFVAGTPSLDRPAVTARADFYYVATGLGPITAALHAARDLRRLRQRAYLCFGIYNVVAVVAAAQGVVSPLVAALLMPTSSIASVLWVWATVNRASRGWQAVVCR